MTFRYGNGGWVGAAALPTASMPAAQASTSMVVYVCGMAGNRRRPAVRPGEIGFGAVGHRRHALGIKGHSPCYPRRAEVLACDYVLDGHFR